VPLDTLAAAGAAVEDIGKGASSPALRECLRGLAVRTGALLDHSDSFSPSIADLRLALEVAVIQALARRLVSLLTARDPLSERVHLGKGAVAGIGIVGVINAMLGRIGFAASHKPRNA